LDNEPLKFPQTQETQLRRLRNVVEGIDDAFNDLRKALKKNRAINDKLKVAMGEIGESLKDFSNRMGKVDTGVKKIGKTSAELANMTKSNKEK